MNSHQNLKLRCFVLQKGVHGALYGLEKTSLFLKKDNLRILGRGTDHKIQ